MRNLVPNLDQFMKIGGEIFEIKRNKQVHEEKGMRNCEESSKRKYIGFYPNADVQAGDWLKGTVSGDEYYVLDVTKQVIYGKILQAKAFYA